MLLRKMPTIFFYAIPRTPKNSSYFENPWYVGWKVCQKTINDKFAQLVGRPNFFHENASVFTLPYVYMGKLSPLDSNKRL